MGNIKKIQSIPGEGKNYYLVDANFLCNKYIPISCVPIEKEKERRRIHECQEWWNEIESQIKKGKARVYVPDICVAEVFKALAGKYYKDKFFKEPRDYLNARNHLIKDIKISPKQLRMQERKIRFHDVPTSRDIIIAVDRFYEPLMGKKLNLSLPDLIVLATAKYLIDFYDIPKDRLFIITLDERLRDGSRIINELNIAYNPTIKEHQKS